jgi:tetratricopeptide (TPR) repeat protein
VITGRRIIIAALVATAVAGAGCATRRGPTTAIASPSTAPSGPRIAATQPLDPNALLTLEQIQPKLELPQAKAATTAPSTQPVPLEAIELYAQARDALLQNQRFTAINLLERALRVDPDSYDLNYDLGRAYLGSGGSNERAIAAFQRAAEVKPDDLQIQTELGRAYQSRGQLPQATERFRLAMQTSEYKDDAPLAAVVDYRLAVALEQQGYVRAALECYNRVLDRLEHPSTETRTTPEVGYLLTRPQLLFDAIGKLYEKLGDYDDALKAYQEVAEAAPNDFDQQARVVQTLVKLRRDKQAIDAAAELVRKFHASSESIVVLRKTYQDVGSEGAFAEALRKLYREHPGDRAILFALADTLASTGQSDEARGLLVRAIESHDGDVEIVQRLYELYSAHDQVIDAAKLIITVTAKHPDTTPELTPLFVDLQRMSRKNSLRLTTLQKIEVSSDASAAKQYWVWVVATRWTRPATAQNALDESAHAAAPFDPACRTLLDSYFGRTDWDDAAKRQAADALIESVQSRGRPDLAAELRGLVALRDQRADQAVKEFGDALKLAGRNPPPDLQLEFALSQLKQGNAPRFEQLMWKLLSDRPRFGAAYQLLLLYFKTNNAPAKAWTLVNTWLAADPNSVQAHVEQAMQLVEQRRIDEAATLAKKLFEQHPDDSDVIIALSQVLIRELDQPQQAIDLLEAERTRHPDNRTVVEALVGIYADQKRFAEASHVLTDVRQAVADDPDLLYYVAHLYGLIDEPQSTDQVLQDVLKLDPTHAQAGNDLGYTWADAGKNLDRAEELIRLAVNAEPDNPSYLDSLGWVLYKRGRFDQASKLLEQACSPAETADPIVLDHLGDDMYRLNRTDQAKQAWQRSLQRMGEVPQRQDLRDLRLKLQTKLRQAEANQPVTVAPVVESSVSGASDKEQAKN